VMVALSSSSLPVMETDVALRCLQSPQANYSVTRMYKSLVMSVRIPAVLFRVNNSLLAANIALSLQSPNT